MARDEVIASKQYLSAIGHWPRIPARANPERWLSGFDATDEESAVALLDSLIFVSQEQTRKLCVSSFHSLSGEVSSGPASYKDRKAQWMSFLSTCLITFPTGETPNPTDSGHAFARLIRQELDIPEARCLFPRDVLASLRSGSRPPIVVVDDFAGSGNQFLDTWRRDYEMPDGSLSSFSSLDPSARPDVYYLPTIATEFALYRIRLEAPAVKLRYANLLPNKYSAVDPESVVFPDHLRSGAADFISRASARAGIRPDDELGWYDLALAIAFEHSVPDATLPIIWTETPAWKPLMRRS